MELGNLNNYPESTKGYQHKKKADKLASAGRHIIINADNKLQRFLNLRYWSTGGDT